MSTKVNQPTSLPTQKLSGAVIAAAVFEFAWVALSNIAPEWADPSLKVALTPLAAYLGGYFIRDMPNVPVTS